MSDPRMEGTFIALTAHDPVVVRDARPFDPGMRMRADGWLRPSQLAGSIRTRLGLASRDPDGTTDFDRDLIAALRTVEVAGGLPIIDGEAVPQLCFPAPSDAVLAPWTSPTSVQANAPAPPHVPTNAPRWKVRWRQLKPLTRDALGPDEGMNLPRHQQRVDDETREFVPAPLGDGHTGPFKPHPLPAYWSWVLMEEWLLHGCSDGYFSTSDPILRWPSGFFGPPVPEQRVHNNTSASDDEGRLFTSTGQHLRRLPQLWDGKHRRMQLSLRTRVHDRDATPTHAAASCPPANGSSEAPTGLADQRKEYARRVAQALGNMDELATVGGERRLVHAEVVNHPPEGWTCPDELREALREAAGVRMILVTPAIFESGWLPTWVSSGAAGVVGLRLAAARLERWQPVAGWALHDGGSNKALRRMAPAGSVYFFRKPPGTDVTTLWMEAVSDAKSDRMEGFGLAVWGVWDADS